MLPACSLISGHSLAGTVFTIPILQMWKLRFRELKVTSLGPQSEETVKVGFEPRTSGSVLSTLRLDHWWQIGTIIFQFQSPALLGPDCRGSTAGSPEIALSPALSLCAPEGQQVRPIYPLSPGPAGFESPT